MGFYCEGARREKPRALRGREQERPELNEPFAAGRPRTVPSLHVTQRSMISADLAADGPPQTRAKVKCQSAAKHLRVEGDPEAAGMQAACRGGAFSERSAEKSQPARAFSLLAPFLGPQPQSAQQISGRRAKGDGVGPAERNRRDQDRGQDRRGAGAPRPPPESMQPPSAVVPPLIFDRRRVNSRSQTEQRVNAGSGC